MRHAGPRPRCLHAATVPSRRIGRRTLRGITATLLLLTISCANAQPVVMVCEPTPAADRTHLRLPPEAIDHVVVKFDLGQLQLGDQKRINLCLPGGGSLPINKTGAETINERVLIWRGKVEGDEHSIATFSVVDDVVVGDVVTSGGKMYRVEPVSRGVQVVMLLDPKRFPPEGRVEMAIEPPPQYVSPSPPCPRDSEDRIDVMVMYTEAACAATGAAGDDCTDLHRSAIEAKIYQAVSETNQTYANSDVKQRLSLVHVGTVGSYTEAQTLEDDWHRLRFPNDTYLDNVQGLRNLHRADAVVLITKPTDEYPGGAECGASLQMSTEASWQEENAFTVVPVDCATGNFSFGHELGHIMGADHNQGGGTMPHPFRYSHGLTTPTFRTVMATETSACAPGGSTGCSRLPNWSNPAKTYQGASMGIADAADNARALNDTADTVSNFRASSDCGKDVWMKDTWQDSGEEPDPALVNEFMWKSPYIWLRTARDPDAGFQHQHQNQELLGGPTNWAYVKLHNGGAQTSGTLELRIAKASTGLAWPTSWSVIGAKPVSLAGNSMNIVEFQLDNLPRRGHHCLLARWLSTNDPMKTPEGSEIDANVRGNNNIIWRNVNIIDLTAVLRVGADLVIENPTETPMGIEIEILPTASEGRSFLPFGEVQIELDEALAEAWSKEGATATGFSGEKNVFQVTSKRVASLRGLYLPPKFKGQLKITFSRPSHRPVPEGTFMFDVVQSRVVGDRKEVIGGVTYEVRSSRTQ